MVRLSFSSGEYMDRNIKGDLCQAETTGFTCAQHAYRDHG